MPFTKLTREECRLVTCPTCGATATYQCWFPHATNPGNHGRKARIHKARIEKANQYRSEGRI